MHLLPHFLLVSLLTMASAQRSDGPPTHSSSDPKSENPLSPLDVPGYLDTAIKIITPAFANSAFYRYYFGPQRTPAQAENWIRTLLIAGTAVGGGDGFAANVYTDHGVGSVFWLPPGGHYNLDRTKDLLSPENSLIREKAVPESRAAHLKLLAAKIGVDAVEKSLTAIVELAFHPTTDLALLEEILKQMVRAAPFTTIFFEAGREDLRALLGKIEGWEEVGSTVWGAGKADGDGELKEGGKGWEEVVWLFRR